MRNELMERRIKQTDIDRTSVHSLKNTLEVCLLIRKELGESFLTSFCGISKDHLTHGDNLLILKEHVLGTCKTDTFCTKGTSDLRVMWRVCISTNLQLRIFVTEIHQFLKVTAKFGSLSWNLTCINLSCSTIQRNIVTLLKYLAVNLNGLGVIVYIKRADTTDAALTHTTGNNGSV